jgi:hypothetical protein
MLKGSSGRKTDGSCIGDVMKSMVTSWSGLLGRTWIALIMTAIIGCAAGCSTAGFTNGGSGTPPTTNPNLTGNWQIQITPTTGGSLFQSLSGFIYEEAGTAGTQQFTTSAFQIQAPTTCYLASQTIPSKGYSTGAVLSLRSFSVNGQFMVVNANIDSIGDNLTGTYVIDGGCANTATGTFTGVRYAQLTGTYSGPIDGTNMTKTLQLSITQYVQGNGDGIFLATGSATFTGFPCFMTGTLPDTGGLISGSSARLTFNTPDPSGAQIVLVGTFDPTADTLTLTSINITSGSCEGSYGTATLKQQS